LDDRGGEFSHEELRSVPATPPRSLLLLGR